jgi:hypothetical protein
MREALQEPSSPPRHSQRNEVREAVSLPYRILARFTCLLTVQIQLTPFATWPQAPSLPSL